MKLFLKFIFLLVVTSCATSTNHTKKQAQKLIGVQWTLSSIYGEDISLPAEGPQAYITFRDNEQKEVSGSTGCNSFFGTYLLSGDTLVLSDINKTLRACQRPYAELESSMMKLFNETNRFEVENETLEFFKGEEMLARFTRGTDTR